MGEIKQIMSLLDYLSQEQILFLNVSTRDEALNQLTDLLHEKGILLEKETFHDAILQREQIVSTGIGMGVAIPHAKLEGYDHFFLALGIQSEEGIEWDAIDGAPVRLVFMIGGPAEKQAEYLNILSQLTTIMKDEKLRTRILRSSTPKEAFSHFSEALA